MYYDFIESFKCRTLTLSLSKKWVTFLCPMLAFLINDDFKGLRSILFNINLDKIKFPNYRVAWDIKSEQAFILLHPCIRKIKANSSPITGYIY